MKLHVKTPSKNLAKLMRSGETAPAHPTTDNQKETDTAENKETNIEDELQQLDVDSFESILRSVAASKTDFLQDELTRVDPAIMGLIDDAKERLTAEKDRNCTIRSSDKPDDEVIIDKPPVVVAKKVATLMKAPVCGNPVTDYDKINEMNSFNVHIEHLDRDEYSRMEMGQAQAFDDVDIDKLNKCQKNIRCDEQEQINWLEQKGLTEFNRFNTILSPISKGEFVTFNHLATPVIACDVGVLNPISTQNLNVFQTVASNGRLLPALPRMFFGPNDASPKPIRKSIGMSSMSKPVTVMLKSTAPIRYSSTFTDSQLPSVNSFQNGEDVAQKESASKKKRNKAKRSAEASLNAATNSDEMNSSVEDIDKQGNDIDDEEKENKDDGLTEEEREARRIKNIKNRNKKKQRKERKLEESRKESEATEAKNSETTPLDNSRKVAKGDRESIPFGNQAANQDKMQKDQPNGPTRRVFGGKNKKNMKSVSSEYTVGVDNDVTAILHEFGINHLSELTEGGPSKKKQKANNNTNNSKKNKQQQQQNQKKDQKGAEKSGENGKAKAPQKSGKKMDDVADAASITKRCSSGVSQQSEEDDDQSYVSAQENLGGSNGSLSPNEFVDAQSREEFNDNVMADPNNYRNDEEVASLAKELYQRDLEFITVGGKKKNKKQSSVQETEPHSSTESSSSPSNRRNTHPDARVSSTTGSSNSGNNHHQQKKNTNNPTAPTHTLGDYYDLNKGISKNKKVGAPLPSTSQKKQALVEESKSLEFVDAPETPMSVNTAHTFSYADAAKKSSGENTPANDMSPIPQSTTNSTAPSVRNQPAPSAQSGSVSNEKKKTTDERSSREVASAKPAVALYSNAVQLPPSVVGAVSDISFGYEETPEDARKRQQKEAKTAAPSQEPPKPTRMNGVDLLKSFTQDEGAGKKTEIDLNEMPKNPISEADILVSEILTSWSTRWNEFCNTGKKPVMFKPVKK